MPQTPGPRRSSARERAVAAVRSASLVRLRIGFVLMTMVVSIFAVRLFQLQSLDASDYAERARAVGAVSETLPAARGKILDRNDVPLAESLDGLMIVADPTKTAEDAAEIATVLADDLGIDYISAVRNLTWPETRFRYVARRLPATEVTSAVQKLKELGFKGVETRVDPLRTYPSRDVAANLVGRVNDQGQGADGAELLFDELLGGEDGSTVYDKGSGGARIPLGDNSTIKPVNGEDINLTIDRDVQWYAQRVLRQTVEDAGADSGFTIAMDSQTGQLLALADYPTYDPSAATALDPELLGSRALREVYEPGSVQKVLTAASLVDAGKAAPDTMIDVPESITSSGRTVRDYFPHGDIKLTLSGILARSSNIGTALLARELPPKRYYRYLRSFGLGQRTGLEGYIESAGLLSSYKTWPDITRDNIAFGQGLAVNGVQMAAAINTIANDGVYVQPSLVLGSENSQFGVLGSDNTTSRQVISEPAAESVAEMMEMVTTPEVGTAPNAVVPGYRVAGKTGTAQVADLENGGYKSDEFVVSFAGFAPADDPRFTVYVVIKNNRNGLGGGATAGPAFRKLMSYLLQKYAVPPTGTTPPAWPNGPEVDEPDE